MCFLVVLRLVSVITYLYCIPMTIYATFVRYSPSGKFASGDAMDSNSTDKNKWKELI